MGVPNNFPPIFEDKLSELLEAEKEDFGRELSAARAYQLEVNPIQGSYDREHFAKIHQHLFQDLSTHAGVVRGYGMSKGSTQFADPSQMTYLFEKELPERIESAHQSVDINEAYVDAMTDLHSTLDLAHPFREGNGRATRAFMSQLAKDHSYYLDFSKLTLKQWIEACINSINTGKEALKRPLFEKIVTPLHVSGLPNL